MEGRSGRLASIATIIVVGVALVALIIVPLAELVRVGWEQVGFSGSLRPADAGIALLNSVWVGAAVAALAVVAGAAGAFLTERIHVEHAGWLRAAILMPLLVPGFVSALSFIRAYGPSGFTDDIWGLSLPGLFGPAGIIIVLAINATPIAYLVTVAALRSRSEPDLERAALVHGATRSAMMMTVALPLLGPALLGAAALVFVTAINAFGAPAFLGVPAGFATVTTRIYQDLALAARPEAFSRAVLLAVILVAVALVFVLIAERLISGLGPLTRTGSDAGWPSPASRRSLAWPVVAAVLVALTTLGPLLMLILTALTRAVGLDPTPVNWTLAHFREALAGANLAAFGRSLGLSAMAATLVVVLGSLVTSLRRTRFGRPFRSVVLLTFAVPGSTLAVAVLLAYGATLRDTLLIVLIAYLSKLWGLGHRVVEGSADAVAPDLYLAARASGASAPTATITVLGPIMSPSLLGSWLLVFVFAFHELTMSSLLYGPGTSTLAVVVLNLQQLGEVSTTAALAVLLTVPVLLFAVPMVVLSRRSRLLQSS